MTDNDQKPATQRTQKETENTEKKATQRTLNNTENTEKKASASKASPKLAKIIEEIEKLSVIELADLVKALEEKFGVTAGVPQMAAAPSGQPGEAAQAGPQGSPAAGQTTFNVVLTAAGANKISLIKAVKEVNQNLGLKDAKELVESVPKEVLSAVNKETADEAKEKLEKAGGTVELK